MSTVSASARLIRWSAALAILLGLAASRAQAAPLDVFLTAVPERDGSRGLLELGADHMNDALDVFHVREPDPDRPGADAGSYRGRYVTASWRPVPQVTLSGGLGHRHVSDGVDGFDYRSWQLAGQYRLIDTAGTRPAVAVRLAAWGNHAASTQSTTPVTVPGAILDSVRVDDPGDQQWQLDAIATWSLTPSLDASVFLGGGSTRLRYGGLSATTRRNGCNYQLAFNGNDIFGTLIPPCTAGGGVLQQFYDSSGDYGVDVASEIAWRGRFMQVGGNAVWSTGSWTLSGGYLFHWVQREAVDDILASRGKSTAVRNHVVAVQADYRLNRHLSLFSRGQLSSNLFFNDLPVTYNSSTASRFGSRYALLTVGLRVLF